MVQGCSQPQPTGPHTRAWQSVLRPGLASPLHCIIGWDRLVIDWDRAVIGTDRPVNQRCPRAGPSHWGRGWTGGAWDATHKQCFHYSSIKYLPCFLIPAWRFDKSALCEQARPAAVTWHWNNFPHGEMEMPGSNLNVPMGRKNYWKLLKLVLSGPLSSSRMNVAVLGEEANCNG